MYNCISAIKTGRYTHEKKNRDIEEVKRLELQAKMKKEGKMMLTPEEREKELDRIIRHITTVHLQQTPHTPDFFEKLPEREAEFLVSIYIYINLMIKSNEH